MTDINELKSWIAHAEEDFAAAKVLTRLKKPLLSGACFHAQQSAEKYLKALLILRDVDFPKTHDLPSLNTICNEAGILTGLIPQQLIALTEYAVRRRYLAISRLWKNRRKQLKSQNRFAVLHARI